MDIEYLREFTVVAERLSFSDAARYLGVSQPSLSKHMMAVEADLGVELFDRQKQRPRLTPVGKVYLRRMKRFLMEYDSLREEVHDLRKVKPLHLSIQAYTGHRLLNDTLRLTQSQLDQEYPLLELSVEGIPEDDVIDRLEDDTLDMAILPLPDSFGNPMVHVERLYAEPLVAIIPSDNPLSRQAEVSLEDLQSELVWVACQPNSRGFMESVEALFASEGAYPKFRKRLWTDYDELNMFDFSEGVYVGCERATVGNMPEAVLEQYKPVPIADARMFLWATVIWKESSSNKAIPLFFNAYRSNLKEQ